MMKTILNYVIFAGMCCSMSMVCQSYGAEGEKKEGVQAENRMKVEFPGAIVLKPREVKDVGLIREVQEGYIGKRHEGYHVVYNMYIKDDNGRFIEMYSLRNDEGEKALIYFDMTEVYKKLKSKDRKTKEKIEELEKLYSTITVS